MALSTPCTSLTWPGRTVKGAQFGFIGGKWRPLIVRRQRVLAIVTGLAALEYWV
jgi:hypothetical protein